MNARSPRRIEELEREPIDDVDQAALRTLRAIYEHGDPVPPGLIERVKFALTLDDLEAEVARLQRDFDPQLVARSEVQSEDVLKARTVTFTSDAVTAMVTVTPITADRVRLDGWAAPGAHLAVELRLGQERHHVVADGDGRFVFEEVEHGLAQLVLRPTEENGGGHPVITPAIEI